MKNIFPSVLAGVALCATTAANSFSVSGPGGPIPDCPFSPGTWNAQPNWPTFTSSVTVSHNVTSIKSIQLHNFAHPWRGDIHIFLSDPNNVRYNIIVRSGFTGTGSGDSGDYLSGRYLIVESGASTVAQGGVSIPGGIYNQYFNSGGGMWTSGSYPINNTPMSAITGPKGTWTLNIVDWFSGDVGSLTGWTLNGNDVSGFIDLCDATTGNPDCSSPSSLCNNAPLGAGPRGCNNCSNGCSTGGGARLTLTGEARINFDTLVMTVTEENCAAFTIFTQSAVPTAPLVFGAGFRCLNNPLNRLYMGNASGGALSKPNTGAGDPDITDRSITLGRTINSGDTRYYMTFYRDPCMGAQCSDPLKTFNASQTVQTTWGL